MEQPQKRRLLKAIGIATLATIATGGIRIDLPGQKTPGEIQSPELLAYQKRLNTLNQEILRNPQNLKEIAPRIGQLAIEFFSGEMDYNPQEYEGKTKYKWDNEYQISQKEESGCIELQTSDDEYGYVNVVRDDLSINLDKVLYGLPEDKTRKVIQPYPAFALFSTLIHELHHLTSPFMPDPDSNDPRIRIRGLVFFEPNLEFSKPRYTCYDSYRTQLEEAVVQDSTDRMTQKLGFQLKPDKDYQLWVQRYRIGVLEKFFDGDNQPLLKLHQQTKPREFFTVVGQKLGAPSQEAAAIGESYLRNLLLEDSP